MAKILGATLIACLLSLPNHLAWAVSPAAVLHLCTPKETVLFACETGKNLASVCASSDISPQSGYVQFRYGTSDATEIEWPEQRSGRRHVTKGNLFYSNKIGSYLRFRKERGSFVVFSVTGKSSGLVIEKDTKVTKKRVCQKSVMVEISDLPLPTSEIIAVSGIVEK